MCHSAHRGGLELSTGTGFTVRVGRPSVVWSRWVKSSTRLGGFRTLKKTTEAPHTTTTELYRVSSVLHTSRGTTPAHVLA